MLTTWNHLKRNAQNAASSNHRAKFNTVTVIMFTQDIFARNAVMVIGIDAVLVVIRGIRVTLMRLTMKKIIEHNPRKGIFLPKNIIHLICYLFISGSLFHLLLFRLLLFTIKKKGRHAHVLPYFNFIGKRLSLYSIYLLIFIYPMIHYHHSMERNTFIAYTYYLASFIWQSKICQ